MPRYMMIVKATKDSEAGVMPDDTLLAEMGKYNEQLVKAGVMLDGAGLQPSAKGWRVQYGANKKGTVVDGPFAETKELIAGYWIIQTRTREEALEWSTRIPNPHPGADCHVEVRQLFELDDFEQTPGVDKHREVEARLQSKSHH